MSKSILTATLVLALFAATAWADGELIRGRSLFNEAKERDADVAGGGDEAGTQRAGHSAFNIRWDQWGNSYYSKGGKGSKGSKSSKGPKGMKGHHYPHYTKPPHFYTRPPVHPPAECPKIENCKVADADKCSLSSLCEPACVPKFCKIPTHPHKVHPHGTIEDDKYVALGSLCGAFRYLPGTPRHTVSVCCAVYDDDTETPETYGLTDHTTECSDCADCIFPQKVNDACCREAGVGGGGNGRDGTYYKACPEGKECCKCGPDAGSYKCIDESKEHCDTTNCPGTTSTTAAITPSSTESTTSSTESTTSSTESTPSSTSSTTSSTESTPSSTSSTTSSTESTTSSTESTTSTTSSTTSTTTSTTSTTTPECRTNENCPDYCIDGKCRSSQECDNLCDNVFRRIFGTGDNRMKCCPDNEQCNEELGLSTTETIYCSSKCGTDCLGPTGNDSRLPKVICYFREDPAWVDLELNSCQSYIDTYCPGVDPFENINANTGCPSIQTGDPGSPVCTDDALRICCVGLPITPLNCDENYLPPTPTP